MSDKQWMPLELVRTTAEFLGKKGVQSPRLDAEVLLAEVLSCQRLQLYTLFERALTEQELGRYRDFVRRRAAREPVSRILGRREFMGIDFTVTPEVLSPRPETEILAEEALKLLEPAPKKKKSAAVFEAMDRKMREFLTENAATIREGALPQELAQMLQTQEVTHAESAQSVSSVAATAAGDADGACVADGERVVLDLGTGSGCLPISLVKMARRVRAVAVDISTEALRVARSNAAAAGVAERIDFREGDFFAACAEDERFDLIVSNPPYLVPGDDGIWPEVAGYDPALALYGGADGLECYRKIIPQAGDFLKPGGALLLEIGQGQEQAVEQMLLAASPLATVTRIPDYAGVVRVLCAKDL